MAQQPTNQTPIVTRAADAETRLAQSLSASHGTAFAQLFQADYAEQIASALQRLGLLHVDARAPQAAIIPEAGPAPGTVPREPMAAR